MPNTDERRGRAYMMESCSCETETLDPNFDAQWEAFLKKGPHYGRPTEIAKQFRDFKRTL